MKATEPDQATIEHELAEMAPAELPGSLVDQLSRAMDDAVVEARQDHNKIIEASLDHELAALEKTLVELVPHGMPANMIGRLDQAMARWHEKVPLQEKVIPLRSPGPMRKRPARPGIRAVASVALLGAGAAFLTTSNPDAGPSTSQRIPVLNDGSSQPVVFTPGDARASVVSANDRGVVWTEGGLPVRCVEVESKNEIHFRNERGEKLIITQPKREIRFTPVKFD